MSDRSTTLLLACAAALAQPTIGAAQDMGLEEIVVTAQKRSERTIDVPMTVTVLGSESLDARGIRTIQDIAFAVPGVTMRVDGPGSYELFMRGIGNLAGSEAVTTVYLDETPTTLYLYRQLDLRSLDMERVEVLKGPQGTLYGQGAAAGTVRFISRKPVLNEFQGRVEGELSFIDQGDSNEKVTAVFNVPAVDDTLAFRIAATSEWGGGWIDQPEAGLEDANNQDLYNVRAQMLWRPTDVLEVQATAAMYKLDSELGLDYEGPDRTIDVGVDRARVLPPRTDDYYLYSLTATYDFGSVELVSATGYVDYYRYYTLPYIAPVESQFRPVGGDLEGIATWDDQTYQFTQELRLVSKGDSRFNYTLGAYYRDARSRFVGGGETLVNETVFPFPYEFSNASKSWSLFGDASYKLNDRWEVGVGVRKFEDDQDFEEFGIVKQETFDSTDPRVYASYALSPDVKLYANIARGFRSGGFNSFSNPPYSPEKVLSYEIGAKGHVADNRVSFEVAAYFMDYEDKIRRGLLIVNNQFENIQANIGNVEIRGVEAGFGWQVMDRLTLSGSGAYIDSEVVALAADNSVNEVGDPTDYVPEWSFTLAADYDFQWASQIDGFVHVDLNYRDEVLYTDRFMYYPEFATQASESFTVVSARFGARWEQTSLELFVNNVTNENKSVDPFDVWSQGNRTKPRTIGLRITFDF
jgi:outer membrane receptor protein involved in Fe transport